MASKITMTDVNFDFVVSNFLSVPEQKKVIAEFARTALDAARQVNRSALNYDPKYTTTVDGREGGELESVNPDGGWIVFDFELDLNQVIAFALETLRRLSPVQSGAYARSHTAIMPSVAGEAVVISNPVPYSRRLEVGKTKSGRDFVIQVPAHVYERALDIIKGRFGNQYEMWFDYIQFPDAPNVGLSGRYGIGVRKQTQTHWVASTFDPKTGKLIPAHWVTFKAGQQKTRIRRHPSGPLESPAIFIIPLGM